MSFASRFKEKREELKLTQGDLGKLLGITASAIGNYETGISSPKADILYRVFDVLHCDANYLFQDEMNALHDVHATPDEMEKLVKKYRALDDYAKGTVDIILDRESKRPQTRQTTETPPAPPQKVVPLPKAKRNRTGMVEIKVYDQPAAAGLGNYLDEPPHHIEQYPDGVAPPDTDFGVIISGDSMEPKIHDGGTVFVQSTPTIDPGKIGIFVLNGQAYCKKLAVDRENRQVLLVSLNPKYEDIIVQGSDEIRTLGLVLG